MQLSDVDLTNLDVFEDRVPHEWFEVLRDEAPVHWHEEDNGPGFWAITKYADLKHISKRPQLFSSERQGTLLLETTPASLPFIRNILINMDPPRHRTHRNLINTVFRPRLVEELRPRVVQMVKEIINGVIEKGECEFVNDLAAPLPMLVICEMMGVPEEDRRHIYDVGNRMVGFDDPELGRREPGEMTDGEVASAEMFLYADKLRERATAHPSDDLATALLNAEVDGHKLTEEEFRFFFLVLLIAGNETTRTVTSNGMISLLENRDELLLLQDDPSLIDSAVEEILRYSPAVHCFRRTATEETELRGVKMREDDKVILWYPAANRDEEVFDAPNRFDIRRHPNEHVAFGHGEHYCLGANLARMELQEIFRGLVMRLDGLEMTEKPRRLRSNFINGVKEMRVRFEPGPVLD